MKKTILIILTLLSCLTPYSIMITLKTKTKGELTTVNNQIDPLIQFLKSNDVTNEHQDIKDYVLRTKEIDQLPCDVIVAWIDLNWAIGAKHVLARGRKEAPATFFKPFSQRPYDAVFYYPGLDLALAHYKDSYEPTKVLHRSKNVNPPKERYFIVSSLHHYIHQNKIGVAYPNWRILFISEATYPNYNQPLQKNITLKIKDTANVNTGTYGGDSSCPVLIKVDSTGDPSKDYEFFGVNSGPGGKSASVIPIAHPSIAAWIDKVMELHKQGKNTTQINQEVSEFLKKDLSLEAYNTDIKNVQKLAIDHQIALIHPQWVMVPMGKLNKGKLTLNCYVQSGSNNSNQKFDNIQNEIVKILTYPEDNPVVAIGKLKTPVLAIPVKRFRGKNPSKVQVYSNEHPTFITNNGNKTKKIALQGIRKNFHSKPYGLGYYNATYNDNDEVKLTYPNIKNGYELEISDGEYGFPILAKTANKFSLVGFLNKVSNRTAIGKVLATQEINTWIDHIIANELASDEMDSNVTEVIDENTPIITDPSLQTESELSLTEYNDDLINIQKLAIDNNIALIHPQWIVGPVNKIATGDIFINCYVESGSSNTNPSFETLANTIEEIINYPENDPIIAIGKLKTPILNAIPIKRYRGINPKEVLAYSTTHFAFIANNGNRSTKIGPRGIRKDYHSEPYGFGRFDAAYNENSQIQLTYPNIAQGFELDIPNGQYGLPIISKIQNDFSLVGFLESVSGRTANGTYIATQEINTWIDDIIANSVLN